VPSQNQSPSREDLNDHPYLHGEVPNHPQLNREVPSDPLPNREVPSSSQPEGRCSPLLEDGNILSSFLSPSYRCYASLPSTSAFSVQIATAAMSENRNSHTMHSATGGKDSNLQSPEDTSLRQLHHRHENAALRRLTSFSLPPPRRSEIRALRRSRHILMVVMQYFTSICTRTKHLPIK
jgi:hypothetical protein